MASDRQQFKQVFGKYITLRRGGVLSEPDVVGAAHAVLVPYLDEFEQFIADQKSREPDVPWEYDSYEYLEAEGRALAAQIAQNRRVPVLRLRATVSDFREVLRDRSIAALTICGLGNFSSVVVTHANDEQLRDLPSRRKDGRLRWMDLAYMADHLKQGLVTQRVSGLYKYTLNVPLTWGIVNDHRNIRAPIKQSIHLSGLEDENNQQIQQITELSLLDFDGIRATFPWQRRDHGTVINALPDPVYEAGAVVYRVGKKAVDIASHHDRKDYE